MLSVERAVRVPLRTVADGVSCRSSKTALEIVLFALATWVYIIPVPTAAQTGVAPSASSSVVSGRPASPGPDLIDLLRPCAAGVSGDSALLVHVPPGVGVWGARCKRRPLDAQYVSGTVTESANQYYVRTEAGTRLRLVSAFPYMSEPVKVGNAWVYQGTPPRFFGLARPTAGTQPGPNQTVVVTGDMALSFFVRKPIELPERFQARTQHRNRFWVEGIPVAGPDGAIVRWVGTYASPATDLGPPMPGAASPP